MKRKGLVISSLAIVSFVVFLCIIGYVYKNDENNDKNNEVTVGTYDMGDFVFEENGVEITSPIKGAIGIPKEDNSPVVFILHGSHRIDGDVRQPYAEGFEYLVEHLANQGYLAISINVNRAYMFEPVEGNELERSMIIFEENYRRVKEAIEGEKLYPYSLKGKGDLTKINLIGHSRGGENIFNIIESNKFNNIAFVSAISVAPSQNNGFHDTYTDIPTAVVIPQFDTDVSTQDGVNYFNYAYFNDQARRSPIQYAYYLNADHNPFNSNVDQKGLFSYDDVTYVTEEEQRSFLKEYCVDFLNVYNKEADFNDVFINASEDRYGNSFIPAYYFSEKNGKKLIRPSASMKDVISDGVEFNYMQAAVITSEDSSGAFNLPGTYSPVPLYKMAWTEKKGKVSIEIPIGFHNFYDYNGISFLIGLDSTDDRNGEDVETAIDIKLIDFAGGEETIRISSKTERALQFIQGEVNDYGDGFKKYNHYTPLGSFILSYDLLKEIKAKDGIEKIEISPASDTGSIVIGGIDFYQ
ncbi:MAG: hypothetical protein KIC94_07645 [Clostridiales bacterium]|nr:hypothetical protein [Clostridiales bacterium]